jgi:hypothetical protein
MRKFLALAVFAAASFAPALAGSKDSDANRDNFSTLSQEKDEEGVPRRVRSFSDELTPDNNLCWERAQREGGSYSRCMSEHGGGGE